MGLSPKPPEPLDSSEVGSKGPGVTCSGGEEPVDRCLLPVFWKAVLGGSPHASGAPGGNQPPLAHSRGRPIAPPPPLTRSPDSWSHSQVLNSSSAFKGPQIRTGVAPKSGCTQGCASHEYEIPANVENGLRMARPHSQRNGFIYKPMPRGLGQALVHSLSTEFLASCLCRMQQTRPCPGAAHSLVAV